MKKFLFACDLDNTLIHSYKNKKDDDICIEIYNGREQSFISNSAVELLKKIFEKVLFVPVTTRSVEQYQRIKFPKEIKPKFAVVSNGGNFFCDDEVDKNWRRDIYFQIQPYENELHEQQKNLSQNKNFTVCRIVDDSFLFLKCAENIDAENFSKKLQEKTKLFVQSSGRKIYFFPPNLNKGESLIRLKKIFNPEKIFCAGDSSIDIPMLKISDLSFVPNNFSSNQNQFIKFSSTTSMLKKICEHLLL